ncbi:MAG: response regulator [Chloroflexota bacterium]|nr:response regulator [Chloroflexota bacterium]
MPTTKVLVVDDDVNIQRVLVGQLRQEGYDVVVATDGMAAVALAASERPDLILMDVAMPRLDGYAATQQIRAAESGGRVPILMLAAEVDADQRIQALRAGADDFILKPFHPLELSARMKALLSRSQAARPASGGVAAVGGGAGRLCVFYGAKGGVGTTTIAINAAIALARYGKRTAALVDANLQFGDLRVFLDIGLDQRSIVDAISEPELDADLLRDVMVTHPSGVDLLLAPPSPEAADIVVERQRQDAASVTNLLNVLRRTHDVTIVDTAKTIDDFNLHLMDEADVIYVVLTADLSCLKNVRLVIETMDNLGYERGKVQLVLNRSNAYTGINVRNIEAALQRKIDHQIINEYRAAISALNSGEPVMWSRPDTPLARSVRDFARAIADEAVPAEAIAGRR